MNYYFSLCVSQENRTKRRVYSMVVFHSFNPSLGHLLPFQLSNGHAAHQNFTLADMALHTVNGQHCLMKTNSTQLKHCNQQFIRQINKNNPITHVHVSYQYLTSLHIRGYTSDMDRPKCWCGLRSSKENRNHNIIFSWCTSSSLNIFKKIRSQ